MDNETYNLAVIGSDPAGQKGAHNQEMENRNPQGNKAK